MSNEVRRPPTRGWSIGSNGSTERTSGKVIAIDEGPAIDSAAVTRVGPPQERHAADSAAVTRVEPPRTRRATLETLDQELAVLDRPLEGDVEYFDEPRPSRWPRAIGVMAVVMIVGVGGAVFLSRQGGAADTREQASAPPAAITPPVLATQTTLAPAAPEAAPAEAAPAEAAPAEAAPAEAAPPVVAATEAPADDPAADEGAEAAPVSRSAWTKVRGKSAHSSKQARAGSSKATARRVTKTRRTAVAKHTVSRGP
jgi:hypothetical protein